MVFTSFLLTAMFQKVVKVKPDLFKWKIISSSQLKQSRVTIEFDKCSCVKL